MNIVFIEVLLVVLALLISCQVITADNSKLLSGNVQSTFSNNETINTLLPYFFIYLLIYVLISLVLAYFISKIGAKRKIGSTASFWYSFLFTPMIALIIVLSSDETKQ